MIKRAIFHVDHKNFFLTCERIMKMFTCRIVPFNMISIEDFMVLYDLFENDKRSSQETLWLLDFTFKLNTELYHKILHLLFLLFKILDPGGYCIFSKNSLFLRTVL